MYGYVYDFIGTLSILELRQTAANTIVSHGYPRSSPPQRQPRLISARVLKQLPLRTKKQRMPSCLLKSIAQSLPGVKQSV